ncbi:MAG: type II toxin-antitoxin system RelE/ParE family toxin [Treponema sp.]|nr:type II toxin-antitoxin system RelE/ParE family toxin [Treponema sp.]
MVYTLIVEYEVRQTTVFSKWLSKIRDAVAKASIARRIARLEKGNFGDSKSVGGGVYELKIDVGKGYRVYFTNKGGRIVILLVGGDKSTQDEDIKTAKEMAKEA